MFITVAEYRERYFSEQSRPTARTVHRWIKAGRLRAEKRGREYYIDTNNQAPATGNALVDRVLGAK